MSTKIYNGFQFTKNDIFYIDSKIQKIRHKIDKYILDEYSKITASLIIRNFDKKCCNLEKIASPVLSPVHRAMDYLFDETKKMRLSNERHFLDFSASVTIHLYENNFYGILFTDNKYIRNLWFEQPYIKDFSYWDNTDKPNHINDKKWNERSIIWNKILKDFHYIPSLNGFTAELTKEMFKYIPLDLDFILSDIPNYETRLQIMINACADMKKYKQSDFQQWKKSNIGKKTIKQYFSKKLKKEITKEMLLAE